MEKKMAIEERVRKIELRNARVELDKAWEVSLTRRLAIASLTYVVITGYLIIIHREHPLINALIPAMGYFLSTLVLRQVKYIWQKRHKD